MKEQTLNALENCVKCGSCKALCPTYRRGRAEPESARGRLMLLRELERGQLEPSALLNERIWSCLLCGMCELSCPLGISVTEAVYEGRGRLAPAYREGRLIRRLAGLALKRPNMSHVTARTLRPLLPYLYRKGVLPFDLSLPPEPLRRGLRIYKPAKARGRVAVFTGCSVNFLFPSVGESLVHLLVGADYEVVLPAGEVCCGAPLRALGLEKDAEALARKNLEAFGRLKAEAVLSPCPTCTLALGKHYPALIGEGVSNAMDASVFLARKADDVFKNYRPNGSRGKAVWHDPCHLRYGLGASEEPRELVERMGREILEPAEPGCCGMSLALTHRGESDGFLEERNEQYRGAETLLTACPGCMLQLGRRHKKVLHIVQVLDEALHPGGV